MGIFTEVSRYPVKNYSYIIFMHQIYKEHKIFWNSITTCYRVISSFCCSIWVASSSAVCVVIVSVSWEGI